MARVRHLVFTLYGLDDAIRVGGPGEGFAPLSGMKRLMAASTPINVSNTSVAAGVLQARLKSLDGVEPGAFVGEVEGPAQVAFEIMTFYST